MKEKSYYTVGEYECIDIVRHMSFGLGNVVKYLWRAGRKNECKEDDLSKALVYVNDEIDRARSLESVYFGDPNLIDFPKNLLRYFDRDVFSAILTAYMVCEYSCNKAIVLDLLERTKEIIVKCLELELEEKELRRKQNGNNM